MWIGDINNTGKELALYNTVQPLRNSHYTFCSNKTEIMYVYNMVQGKGTDAYKLNMKKLLKNNEVLSFGFDDFNSEFGCICVQAKNLNLYLIDFFN